jgi:hypothetical protein
MPRPLVKHPHPLADRQPDARPMLGRPLEDVARLVEIAGGVQHEFDPQSVPAPFFDLVEVPAVGVARVIGLLVRQVAHRAHLKTDTTPGTQRDGSTAADKGLKNPRMQCGQKRASE